ncbi:MAG: hypothetical protein EBR02_03530 [Alphaproteobacteria bacterium]|nr:hypothetical protein [Alphaproteobacteria bacterium]
MALDIYESAKKIVGSVVQENTIDGNYDLVTDMRQIVATGLEMALIKQAYGDRVSYPDTTMQQFIQTHLTRSMEKASFKDAQTRGKVVASTWRAIDQAADFLSETPALQAPKVANSTIDIAQKAKEITTGILVQLNNHEMIDPDDKTRLKKAIERRLISQLIEGAYGEEAIDVKNAKIGTSNEINATLQHMGLIDKTHTLTAQRTRDAVSKAVTDIGGVLKGGIGAA